MLKGKGNPHGPRAGFVSEQCKSPLFRESRHCHVYVPGSELGGSRARRLGAGAVQDLRARRLRAGVLGDSVSPVCPDEGPHLGRSRITSEADTSPSPVPPRRARAGLDARSPRGGAGQARAEPTRRALARAAPPRSRRFAPQGMANGLAGPAPDDAGPAPWRQAAMEPGTCG